MDDFIIDDDECFIDLYIEPDKYSISNKGRIFNKNTGYELKQKVSKDHGKTGYYKVWLCKESYLVHNLVFISFNGIPNENEVIDHIDRNKLNNNLDNLRAVSRSENAKNRDRPEQFKSKIIATNNNNQLILNNLIEASVFFNKSKDLIRHYINKQNPLEGYILTWENEVKNISSYKPIGIVKGVDFGDYYLIDNNGNIISKRNKLMYKKVRQYIHAGYKTISLMKNGKYTTEGIHRLVAKIFVENGEINYLTNKLVVNHKDENKLNNSMENLEWISKKANSIYSCGKRVNKIDPITNKILNTYDSIMEAERQNNMLRGCINQALKTKGLSGSYKWEFV